MRDEGRNRVLAYFAGVVFAAAGIYMFFAQRRHGRNGLRTTAEIVDREWVESRDSEGGRIRVSYPVVQFRTADGHGVRTRTRTGGALTRQPIGKQVRVIYDPAAPARTVVINSFIGRGSFGAVICLLAGLAIIGFRVYQTMS
jgi:hypothetical protein